MIIPPNLLPAHLLIYFDIVVVLILLFTLYYTPWQHFRNASFRHLFLGAIVSTMVLWNIYAGRLPALEFHILGAMLLSLIFGWQYAILALSLTILSQLFTHKIDLGVYAVNVLLYAVWPVYVSTRLHRFLYNRLPRHFFIYIYASGFFGAALIMLVTVMSTALLLYSFDIYSWGRLYSDFLRYSPLMMFAEAFLTGMLLTLLVVFRPDWVRSFNDDVYIKGK